MNNKLYVEMSDEEYMLFKETQKHKTLETYLPSELAAALLGSIERNNGSVESNKIVEPVSFLPKLVTVGKCKSGDFAITLTIEKRL